MDKWKIVSGTVSEVADEMNSLDRNSCDPECGWKWIVKEMCAGGGGLYVLLQRADK